MLESFIDYFRRESLFSPQDRLLVAVSGGMDSMVLTDLLKQSDISFGIAHCNFQLRGDESEGDGAFVKSRAEAYGVPFYTESFDTRGYAKENNMSLQMAARELRYNWMEEIREKEKYDFLVTAHHINDSIETIILNLIKGTGISGIHGILPKQGKLIRPMLFAKREEIEAYVKENNIPYRKDSSNDELKYERNKLRNKVIPVFKELNPNLENTFKETINNFCAVEDVYFDAINKYALDLLESRDHDFYISIEKLQMLPFHETVLYELLNDFGFNKHQVHQLDELLDAEPGKIFESKEYTLIKDREYLIITPVEKESATFIPIHDYDESVDLGALNLQLEKLDIEDCEITTDPWTAELDMDKIIHPLAARRWRKGDFFYPLGMKSRRKKLSDYFTDVKLALHEKERIWLITSGNHIVWIIGYRLDDRFKITPATRKILRISADPNSPSGPK